MKKKLDFEIVSVALVLCILVLLGLVAFII